MTLLTPGCTGNAGPLGKVDLVEPPPFMWLNAIMDSGPFVMEDLAPSRVEEGLDRLLLDLALLDLVLAGGEHRA